MEPIMHGCTFEKKPYSHPWFLNDEKTILRVSASLELVQS